MKTLSIIIPVYNEELVLKQFSNELFYVLNSLIDRYHCSAIFVLDGCTDDSFKILFELSKVDSRIKLLSLSKRFGHQNSLNAGLDNVDSDAVIMMDSDLQHPPNLIPKLLTAFETGSDVVHTKRTAPQNSSMFDRILSNNFYRVFNLLSDANIPEGTADFRLISRRILNIFKDDIQERDKFLRGLFIWVGFKQFTIEYIANSRSNGSSKYNIHRKISLALNGIISFSTRPLKILTFFGFMLSFLTICYSIFTSIAYVLGFVFPAGWSTLAVSISLLGGLQIFILGVIGQYIAAIYYEIKKRPIYLVDKKINF